MFNIFITFLISLLTTFFIIQFEKFHRHLTGDNDFSGPQKFHNEIIPRIGGISIFFGLLIENFILPKNFEFYELNTWLILCAIPVFFVGLAEDLTKNTGIKTRLIFTSASAFLFIIILNTRITSLGFPFIDFLLVIPTVSLLFTILAITGLSNAFNIIDGLHGLSTMVGILTLTAFGYMGIICNDPFITNSSLVMAGSILGVFIWNYPKGMIFLGDGGAYLIGFWIALMSVLIVSRHLEISPWFAVLINSYPICETLFTIYRRKILQRRNSTEPDALHLHSLLFRRAFKYKKQTFNSLLSANAKTSPYLWGLSCLGIMPAIIWHHSTIFLLIALAFFIFMYFWLYIRIVRFKTPKFFKILSIIPGSKT